MTSRASIDGQLEVKDFGSDVYKTLQKESWGLRLGTADAEGASNISFKPIYWTQ